MWIWIQKHQNKVLPAIAVIIAFGAGFQIGKVTSPYYAAHPIVFSEGAQISPSAAELEALISSSATPTPTVAAAKTEGKFVGSVNSNLYHDPACPSASRIKPANQVWFESREEAERAEYSPSACTRQKLGL